MLVRAASSAAHSSTLKPVRRSLAVEAEIVVQRSHVPVRVDRHVEILVDKEIVSRPLPNDPEVVDERRLKRQRVGGGRRLLRTCVCQLRSSASTRACISANEDRRLVLGVLRLI